jgi:hypothetical protein
MNEQPNSNLQTKSLHGRFLEILRISSGRVTYNFQFFLLRHTKIQLSSSAWSLDIGFLILVLGNILVSGIKLTVGVKIASHDCKNFLVSWQIFQYFQKRS